MAEFYTNLPPKEADQLQNTVNKLTTTDYETDYTGNYTAIIGCKVNSLDNIPEGLRTWEFNGGTYRKFIAKGKMPEAVLKSWKDIWDKDAILNRTYTADFEIYDPKSQQEENATVEIYISVE